MTPVEALLRDVYAASDEEVARILPEALQLAKRLKELNQPGWRNRFIRWLEWELGR